MSSGALTVSVVTATRNRPQLLRQALLSIRNQTFSSFEAVVVDDGSPAEVHEQYRELWKELDDRFTLHLASPPGSPGSDPGRGRNFGARIAKGDIVAFLDHDDLWVRDDHLATGVRALSDTGAGYYFSHVRFEPEFAGLMWAAPPAALSLTPAVTGSTPVHPVPVSTFLRVMRHSHVHPSHCIVRRTTFDRAGGFIEGLRTADDVNFTLRIADVDPGILYRPEASVAIRMPEGQSFSLSSSPLSQVLAEVQAMIDVRARCRTAGVGRCARSRQAWALRQLAMQMASSNRSEAAEFAREAAMTFVTPGALWFAAKTSVSALWA
jgi:cellulose synthase/poly-beta-1,6-N-acetylglucosamine synthase-like glycosyltransferase